MYKPLQKKNSSWTPTSIQKKSKNFSKLGSSGVQRQREIKSDSQELPSNATIRTELLTANIMRSLESQESEQGDTQTVQRQSEPGEAGLKLVAPPIVSTPVVQLKEIGIQRQCVECAKEEQEKSAEEGKDVDQMSLAGSGIQTKVTVGEPGDVYEQEADRVAAQVMSMPDNSPQVQRFAEEENPVQMKSLAQSITPLVQKQVDESVQMRELVQRAFQARGTEASGDLESRLNASKGGGSPLSEEARAFMEPRFNSDFSSVRVHTGSEAVQMNQELGAQAFTHGRDVFFNQGKYNPGSDEGKLLLAHELTHVVQQTGVVQRQNQKPPNPTINLKEVPILEGAAPKSNVLSHMQSLGGSAGHDSSVYRKEILQFQRENSADKIAASQQQVLESAKSVDIQQKDNSQTLRRCGGGGGSAPKQSTPPVLSKKTVSGGPTPQDCGGFSWVVQWILDKPSPAGGWIVQKVELDQDIKGCDNKPISNPRGLNTSWYPLWEAWKVNPNQKVTTYAQSGDIEDDTYGSPSVGDKTKGYRTVKGTAEFYEGLTLPSSFKVTNAAPTWILPATKSDPGLTGGSGSIAHNLKAEWNCCEADKSTKLTPT